MSGRAKAMLAMLSVAALAGGASPFPERRQPSSICPKCKRGKLVKSKTGARYCHRCAHFEPADVVRARAEIGQPFPKDKT